MPRRAEHLRETADRQGGCFTSRQAAEAGVSADAIRAQVDAGRWVRVHSGVYSRNPGPLAWLGRVWAGVLAAGPLSAATAGTALRLHGLATFGSDERVLLALDHTRRVVPLDGVTIRRRRNLASAVHPAKEPAVVRVEEAVLQEAATRRETEAFAVIADSCQSRLTTPHRLRLALDGLPAIKGRRRWRAVLDDVANGAHSFLEIEYLRRVERAHNLPALTRQVPDSTGGRRVWRDGLWEAFSLALELDGRLGHEWETDRRADRRRDVLALGAGIATLRLGYADVVDACSTALLIAAALAARGWAGHATPCGPGCSVANSSLNRLGKVPGATAPETFPNLA
jgi:Transcriptional regulator, AbiEi antitoxin